MVTKIKKILFCIMSVGFLVRLAALFLLGRHVSPETWEYNTIALNLIHKKGYLFHWNNTDYHSHAYPLYPMLTALSHILTGENYFILELCHILLSVATCYFIYAIGKKIFDERIGLLSAFLAALHPGLIVYATKLHELTLVVFLINLIFWYIAYSNQGKVRTAVLIGTLIGAGMLTRPTFLFFLPAYGTYLWISSKTRKHAAKMLLLACLCATVVITPWTLRNYHIHKKFVFITTNSAELFWRGNNPLATGTGLTKDMKTMPELAPKEFLNTLYSLNEIGQYDFFYSETIKFIKSNPAHFVKMILKKIYYFWWFSPQTGLLYPKVWMQVYTLYYTFIFALFWVGIYKAAVSCAYEQKAMIVSIILFSVLVGMTHSLYYVEMRHRWSIESLMLIFSSAGIMVLFDRVKGAFLRSFRIAR